MKADKGSDSLFEFPLLGLIGETGTLLSVLKKKLRDKTSYQAYTPHVIEELGDVLWYFSNVASKGGVRLSDIGKNLDPIFTDWKDGSREISFRDIQKQPTIVRLEPMARFETTLLALAAEIGVVTKGFLAESFRTDPAALQGRLAVVMQHLIKAANIAGVTLEQAAEGNLRKIFDRWPSEKNIPTC